MSTSYQIYRYTVKAILGAFILSGLFLSRISLIFLLLLIAVGIFVFLRYERQQEVLPQACWDTVKIYLLIPAVLFVIAAILFAGFTYGMLTIQQCWSSDLCDPDVLVMPLALGFLASGIGIAISEMLLWVSFSHATPKDQ